MADDPRLPDEWVPPDWPPVCDMCNDEIDEPAALVFSPPKNHGVRKWYYVCDMCWLALREHFHGR